MILFGCPHGFRGAPFVVVGLVRFIALQAHPRCPSESRPPEVTRGNNSNSRNIDVMVIISAVIVINSMIVLTTRVVLMGVALQEWLDCFATFSRQLPVPMFAGQTPAALKTYTNRSSAPQPLKIGAEIESGSAC